jgi:predicted transposase YdaD
VYALFYDYLLYFSSYLYPQKIEGVLNLPHTSYKEYLDKMNEAFQMTVLGTMLKEDGKIEGALSEKNKAIEIARELLDILTVETIAKKTGLSVKEVEKLKNEAVK